jgi:CoA binding domain
MHNRGVGTLLLEHLVSLARSRGLVAFRAETLAQNVAMARVFACAGLPVDRRAVNGVVEVTIPLTGDGTYLDAVAERERLADVESLRHLLCPASVAVVGAGRRTGSVGGAILRNLLTGGFGGRVYAVNPNAGRELAGVPCFPSVSALPEGPDLVSPRSPPAAPRVPWRRSSSVRTRPSAPGPGRADAASPRTRSPNTPRAPSPAPGPTADGSTVPRDASRTWARSRLLQWHGSSRTRSLDRRKGTGSHRLIAWTC